MSIEGQSSDDDFAAAFAGFTSPGETPPAAASTPPAADPPAADPPAADPPAADPPAADPPATDAPGAGAPASDPPAAEPPAAEPPAAEPPAAAPAAAAPSADDILGRLADLVAKKPADAAPAAATPPAGETPSAEAPVFSEEEQTFLAEYEKDWEQVSKGEGLKRRQEYQQLLGYIFKQVADFVKPIRDTTEVLAERTHVSDVRGAVPDYSDNLRDEVEAWTKTQPAYLQSAYNQVITQGTVDEVKDLVARYRAETGKATPGGVVPPKPKDNELSGEAKKAAEALAPVDVKRTGVLQPGDPSSFDDAWKQAATDLV